MSHDYLEPADDRPPTCQPSDLGPAWYRFDIDTQALWWSPGAYRLYGYLPGTVTPTLDLVYRHKHSDDRAKFRQLVERATSVGTPFTFEHRIIDASQTQRATLTSARVEQWDEDGAPAVLTCVSVDVSGVPRAHYAAGSDTADGLRHDVATLAEGLESRTVIGRATGILMVRLDIDSEQAFDLLRSRSQHFNVKLRKVAERVNETGRLPLDMDGTRPTEVSRAPAPELLGEREVACSATDLPILMRRLPPGHSLAAG